MAQVHRTITVGNVTFTINNEPVYYLDITSNFCHTQRAANNISWPKGWGIDNCPALEVMSGRFSARATVTAHVSGNEHHDELARWKGGFLQNVTAFHRSASYTMAGEKQVTAWMEESIQHELPMRDGETNEFPFENDGTPFLSGVQTILKMHDEPHLKAPISLTGVGISANKQEAHHLTSTTGGDRFATWLVLFRNGIDEEHDDSDLAIPCIILVGRVIWWSNYNSDGKKAPHPIECHTPAFEQIPLVASHHSPALGDGTKFPDLRLLACANDYSFGKILVQMRQWSFSDDDDPVLYETRPDPNEKGRKL